MEEKENIAVEEVVEEPKTFEFKQESSGKQKKENKLKKELQEKEQKIEELNQKMIRMQADFENYKKRNLAVTQSSYTNGKNDMLIELFPIVDTIEMALISIKDENDKKGIELILKAYTDMLAKNGVEEVPALGEEFDPKYHEAVMSKDDPENAGKIVQVMRKGYKVGDKILRHPMCVVAQ